MGLGRYVKKIKRVALNSNPLVKALTGGVSNSVSSDGTKAVAAKRMISRNEQAGGGQISYRTEVAADDDEVSAKSSVDRARESAPQIAAAPSGPRGRPAPHAKAPRTPTPRPTRPVAQRPRPEQGPTAGRGEAARRLFRDERRAVL